MTSALKILGLDNYSASSEKYTENHKQTGSSFEYKWKLRDFYENESVKKAQQVWSYEKYCDGESEIIAKWINGDNKIILDAGCCATYFGILFWVNTFKRKYYSGIDIIA